MSEWQLRPYQQECINAIPESGRVIMCLATGMGKSLIAANIPFKKRMLWLSHRDELVHQPAKFFEGRHSFGIEMAKERSNGEDVVSASIQSMGRRLNRFNSDEFDVIFCDEVHHCVAPQWRKVLEHFSPRLIVGASATPNRADGVGLDAIFDKIVFERDLKWGIENGYLSDITCLRAEIGYNLRGIHTRLGDYAQDELDAAVNIEGANKAVAEVYRKYAKGATLIFCTSVSHAENLARLIDGAVAISGQTDKKVRADTLKKFTEGKIPCITNCAVFTEGTDCPNIQTIILARPTKNQALYTQMVGRGTRLYPGKEKLLLIDCVGNDIGLCSAPSLLGLEMREGVSYKQADLFDLPQIVEKAADTPQSWIKNVKYVDIWAKSMNYNLHGVNWFRMTDGSMVLSSPKIVLPPVDSLGCIAGEPAQKVFDDIFRLLRDYHADKEILWNAKLISRTWGRKAATDKQKTMISRSFPYLDTSKLNKAEAALILTRCFHKKPASALEREILIS